MLPKFLCFGDVKMLEIQMNQAHLIFSLICFRVPLALP